MDLYVHVPWLTRIGAFRGFQPLEKGQRQRDGESYFRAPKMRVNIAYLVIVSSVNENVQIILITAVQSDFPALSEGPKSDMT
jgi:hypothetical protein